MASKDIAMRVLLSQLNNLQRIHDRFYENARTKGLLENEEFKRILMGYQHDVSSALQNALATIKYK